jgi:hypothetical protein
MTRAVRLLLLLLACCLGPGCGGDPEPTKTSPLPAASERGKLPHRQPHPR